jgi:hypothetical protein
MLGGTLLTLILSVLPSVARTFYVDSQTGNDVAAGTSPDQSWKTLGRVNSAHFQPGDQVLLARNGTWFEQLTVPSSGAEGSPLTIASYGSGAKPMIDAQSTRNRGISIVGKSYVVVNDIGVQNSTSYAIEVFNSAHVSLTNCAIRNARKSAINVGGVSPDARIDGCTYSQDPQFSTDGSFANVFSTVEGATVSNNKIANFTGHIAISFMDVNNALAFGNEIDGGGIGIAINACTRNLTGGQIHDNVIRNVSTAQGDGEAIELTGHVGPPNAHCEQNKANPVPVLTVTAEIYRNRIEGGPQTFGGIDGWHGVGSDVHDNQIENVQRYGMQWTADSTENKFSRNQVRNARVAGFAIYGGKGRSSAMIDHNVIDGSEVAISADANAEVKEDYNSASNVRSVRSASIPAGAHTSGQRARAN